MAILLFREVIRTYYHAVVDFIDLMDGIKKIKIKLILPNLTKAVQRSWLL